jgi:hypothetical protein
MVGGFALGALAELLWVAVLAVFHRRTTARWDAAAGLGAEYAPKRYRATTVTVIMLGSSSGALHLCRAGSLSGSVGDLQLLFGRIHRRTVGREALATVDFAQNRRRPLAYAFGPVTLANLLHYFRHGPFVPLSLL